MASSKALYLFLFAAAAASFATDMGPIVVSAETHEVGSGYGWRKPKYDRNLYDDWAARQTFYVGDRLHFKYVNDSVVEVNKGGYYHCHYDAVYRSHNDGNTTILLDHLGHYYFVSGDPEHCDDGLRMLVNVTSPSPAHPPSLPPAHPPSLPPAHPPSPPPPAISDAPAPAPAASSAAETWLILPSALTVVFISFMAQALQL